jgi:hypothetical protein
MGEESNLSSDQEQQMKKIYNDILTCRDSTEKKKDVRALSSYGKKAIPLIQKLRSIETDDDMKNYMFDTITQIEKGNP